MIQTKKDLNFYLHEDARRNGMDCSFLIYLTRLFRGQENAMAFRYLKALRKCEYHTNNDGVFHKLMRIYYDIKRQKLGGKYSIQIPLNKCGYGLRLIHLSGGGILLNINKIGNYCGFNSGVVLGNKGSSDNRPTLGDNVAFGPGAKAFGKITIGDNVFVAPNAVVTKDVFANSIVGGVPAKLIKVKE